MVNAPDSDSQELLQITTPQLRTRRSTTVFSATSISETESVDVLTDKDKQQLIKISRLEEQCSRYSDYEQIKKQRDEFKEQASQSRKVKNQLDSEIEDLSVQIQDKKSQIEELKNKLSDCPNITIDEYKQIQQKLVAREIETDSKAELQMRIDKLERDWALKVVHQSLLEERIEQLKKEPGYLSKIVEGSFVCFNCRNYYRFKDDCGLVFLEQNITKKIKLMFCNICVKVGLDDASKMRQNV